MNIAICDDNNEHIGYIKSMTAEYMPDASIHCVTNTNELYTYAENENIDIAIIDIVLDNENGITAARKIRDINAETVIIFISGYAEDYFESVYEVEHIYLVKKPIDENIFKSSLQKAIEIKQNNNLAVFIWKLKNETIRVPYADILYFESYKHSVKLVTKNHKKDTILPSVTLKKLSSYLNMGIFIRCHQSFIVNISNYDRAARTEIIMEGASIPVSRRYSGKVKLIIDEERRKQLWN